MNSSPSISVRHHRREAILALGALVAIAALGLAARFEHAVTQLDLRAVAHAHEFAAGHLTAAMLAIADLAASSTVLALTALVAGALVLRRHWHGALAVVVSVAATQALVAIVKHAVARDRPPGEDAIVHAAGYSFPSAHSATSVAFYGVMALIAAHELRGRVSRTWAIAGAAALCVAVGVSRVYLGAHYPTDVLAGWLLGCVIALGSWRGALALRARLVPVPA